MNPTNTRTAPPRALVVISVVATYGLCCVPGIPLALFALTLVLFNSAPNNDTQLPLLFAAIGVPLAVVGTFLLRKKARTGFSLLAVSSAAMHTTTVALILANVRPEDTTKNLEYLLAGLIAVLGIAFTTTLALKAAATSK